MKIIISHDVDHLHWNDHLADLYYPKLWVRETLSVLKGHISIREWWGRMRIPFHRNLHHLEELMLFDKENRIPSTFFFGMAKGLGMSYNQKKAIEAIRLVQQKGFKTGVHGIAFNDFNSIKDEYNAYNNLTGEAPGGIRMHYVRYTEETFEYLNQAGYLFDTSEFDKQTGGTIKAPYRIGRMWEFPLTLMDGYIPYSTDLACKVTLEKLEKAEKQQTEYVSVLLHDVFFTTAYAIYRDWYKWLVAECQNRKYTFINYDTALSELNRYHVGGK